MSARKFFKRHHASEEMTLQITSMADIFTIILVFLLKSFSTGMSALTPSPGVVLPVAFAAHDPMHEGLRIEVTPDVILVDNKAVTKLVNFQLDSNDVESDGTPRSLNAVFLQLMDNEKYKTPNSTPTVTILADRKTPYALLKRVMGSASVSGFGDFKLITVEAN